MRRAARASSSSGAEPSRPILLLGSSGRLGTAFRRALEGTCRILSSPGASLSEPGCAASLLGELRPDLVVNACAMSSPRDCLHDPAGALLANALLPRGLAVACSSLGIPLVHFSTDLVYGGATPPYGERSPCVPRSIYGWTKLLGDLSVLSAHPDALVVRTSVLFGEVGASRRTFSEELLAGLVGSVHVDSWRNHTPVSWLPGAVMGAFGAGARGLLLVAGLHSLARSAFAEMLFAHLGRTDCPPAGYRPPGVPEDLSLDTSRFARIMGDPPDPFQAFGIEYPQESPSTSARNLPV